MAPAPVTESGAGQLARADLASAGSRRCGLCGLYIDCGIEYVNPR